MRTDAQPIIVAPQTHTIDHIGGLHISDPFRPLEDMDDLRVQAWMRAEADRTRALLDALPERASLHARMSELVRVDTPFTPVPRGRRYFFRIRHAADDLPILYVQDGLEGTPRVLLNPNSTSGQAPLGIPMAWHPSDDGSLLAYAMSEAGNDRCTLRVRRVADGVDLVDVIPDEWYPEFLDWAPDGSRFWYLRCPFDTPTGERKLHRKLYEHRLGASVADDVLVFGHGLPKEDMPAAEVSHDGHFLLITVVIYSEEEKRTEVFLLDLRTPEHPPVPIIRSVQALTYATLHRGVVYLHTNDRAPNWRIDAVTLDDALRGMQPHAYIVEREQPMVGFAFSGDACLIEYLTEAHATVVHHDLHGGIVRDVPLPALGSMGSMSADREGDEYFLGFQSFTVPPTVLRYVPTTGACTTFRKSIVPFDPAQFSVEQVWYASRDGTRVPMFLVHRVDLPRDGRRPTLLYGYGGFNVNETPLFRPNVIPFLEAGGIYAVANLRGGGEFGEAWHRAGMRERKQTVFDDFIAAAEWLTTSGWTSSANLGVYGWSNGGLLVGCLLTQRPELVRAAIVGAPVADMLRYHRFDGGRLWIPEYGHPDDREMAPVLLAYSPYHNVRDGVAYPATLIVTADADDRVHPMHAMKLAARLQAANAGAYPILLRVERGAGHRGPIAVSRGIDQAADIFAFLFHELGVVHSS